MYEALIGKLDCIGEQIDRDLANARHIAENRTATVAMNHEREAESLDLGLVGDQIEAGLEAFLGHETLTFQRHLAGFDT